MNKDEKIKELEQELAFNDRRLTEMEEMLVGAKANEDLLLDYIDNICGIIEAQCPLKEQDLWLADMKRFGLYPDNTYEDSDGSK